MTKYLYGASVKKIQTYIFDSSKLQEIAGASELVDSICTELFKEFCSPYQEGNEYTLIVGAAGNIKATIEERNRPLLMKIMQLFPKRVAEFAPGVQFVQAVVKCTGESITKDDCDTLEKLLREQTPDLSPYRDWSITIKAPKTGKPAVGKDDDGKFIDAGSKKKKDAVNKHWIELRKLFGVDSFESDGEKIAGMNSMVAVIHADGNSLGKTLMNLASNHKNDGKYESTLTEFSKKLDEATKNAARKAYGEEFMEKNDTRFRPIILGGDDLTVICAAEKAIPFTTKYLEYFVQETKGSPVLGQLTACAGIAFIKKNFPFYYGVDLAETLCSQTKKVAKEGNPAVIPSSFMFATELGGFVDKSFDAMVNRCMSINGIRLDFGPYRTDKDGSLPFIDDLKAAVDCLAKYPPLKSGLRKMLSELHVSVASAKFMAGRMESVALGIGKEPELNDFKQVVQKLTGAPAGSSLYDSCVYNGKSPILDILTLADYTEEK